METINYQKQGTDFLEKFKVEMEFKKIGHDFYWDDDDHERDIWRITLIKRNYPIQKYSFRFGQSIADEGKKPTAYDILACLTKCDPGTFESFCADFGYDTDSRKAEKTYRAVMDEWLNLSKFFTDKELEELQEIN